MMFGKVILSLAVGLLASGLGLRTVIWLCVSNRCGTTTCAAWRLCART
jgi:hypothetical protein